MSCFYGGAKYIKYPDWAWLFSKVGTHNFQAYPFTLQACVMMRTAKWFCLRQLKEFYRKKRKNQGSAGKIAKK